MTRQSKTSSEGEIPDLEEKAQEVAEETAALELEKLQRKLAREERKKRKEIEERSRKKAIWLLPSLLLITMILAWVFSHLNFQAS